MYGLKKRCKSCDDKMMKAFDESLKISSDKKVKTFLSKSSSSYFK